jgi:hypothetical protein
MMCGVMTWCIVRFSIRDLDNDFTKTEDDIKALQSVGQIIGEVLKKLDDERCTYAFLLPTYPLTLGELGVPSRRQRVGSAGDARAVADG